MTPKQREAFEKKVERALVLLDKKGFDTRYMDASFKTLGAGMRQRSGTVEGWLRNMSTPEINDVLAKLRAAKGAR